jgi:hypothetical protein
MLLLMLIGFFATSIARAEDAPSLTGSSLKIDDAVAKSDIVFEAKLTDAGELDNEAAAKYVGPTFKGAKVESPAFIKGNVAGPIPLTIGRDDLLHETSPLAGQSYLIFAAGPLAHGEYLVMKMLSATRENRQATLLAVLKERAQKKLQQVQQPVENRAAQ